MTRHDTTMKHFAFRLLLLAAFALLASSCASRPAPAPGSHVYSGAKESAYRQGYHRGFQDGRRGRDDDYERFHYEYSKATEDAYERGYDLGYEAGEDQADANEEIKDRVYEDGQEAGQADAENGRSPYYQRHEHKYSPVTESDFRKGYTKGYREGREN